MIDDISAAAPDQRRRGRRGRVSVQARRRHQHAQGGDNGTPLQKDEPQTHNPPDGAYIDYYLKADSPDVKIEVLDAAGAVRATFDAQGGGAAAGGRGGRGGRGGIANVSPLWQATPEPFQTGAGMHRVVFSPAGGGRRGFGGGGGGRGGRGRGRGGPAGPAPVNTGTFTARMTVNGKTYEQTFEMKPDPRGIE